MVAARSSAAKGGPLARETPLEKTRTQPVHRLRLRRGLAVFWRFAASVYVDEKLMGTCNAYANLVTANFIQYCYDTKVPFWLAKYGLLGVQTYWQSLKGHIGRGWEALRSWSLQRPSASRVPITFELLRAMSVMAFALGLSSGTEAHLFMMFSILIRVGFFGLLRPVEICNFRAQDVLKA